MEFPKEPIDGYTLEYWSVYFTGSSACKPKHFRATYHTNTPWISHSWGREDKGGVAFIDEWSLEQEEMWGGESVWCARGRHEGWQRFFDWIESEKQIFSSERSAIVYLIGKFRERIENTKRDLIDMQTTVDRLDSRLIGLSKDLNRDETRTTHCWDKDL